MSLIKPKIKKTMKHVIQMKINKNKKLWNLRHPENKIKSNKPHIIWKSLQKYV